jgi:hypothetical protein
MIGEIIIDGKVMTADHWLELGLPPCLHECLDGTPWVYQNSRRYFGPMFSSDLRCAVERVFRFPKIEDALDPLKLAFFDYRKRAKKEDKSGVYLRVDLSVDNFLKHLIDNIDWALNPSPTLHLTKNQIDVNLDSAKHAVRVLKNSPLSYPAYRNSAHMLVLRMMQDKLCNPSDNPDGLEEDQMKVEEILFGLFKEFGKIGTRFSFGDLLDFWLAHLATQQELGVSRPGRGNAEKRYFCVSLANQFGLLAEKCVYREVAILATAVFSDTSEDYVRKVYERSQT